MRPSPSSLRARLSVCAAVLLAAAVPAGAAAPTDGWQVRFDAQQAGLANRGRLILGASTQTVDGADAFDDPHPPALPSRALDLFTEHHSQDSGWEGQAVEVERYRAQYDAV